MLDNEANDTLEKAQEVPTPCEIAGRIEKKGDRDCYRFTAKKGQVLSIEVFADRLGSAMDMLFALHNDKGDKLTDQDDNPEIIAAAVLHPHRRSAALPLHARRPTAPTRSSSPARRRISTYGPRYIYTVRITPEEPDFRVVAMPMSNFQTDSVVVGQAGHQAFTVFVQRTRRLHRRHHRHRRQAAAGLTMKPQVIAGNQKQSAVVVSAAPEAPPYAGPITLTGDGDHRRQEGRPRGPGRHDHLADRAAAAEHADGHAGSIASSSWRCATRRRTASSPRRTQITVPQGDRISIPVKLTRSRRLQGQRAGHRPGAAHRHGAAARQLSTPGKDATIKLDSKTTVLPGNYTVVLRGQTQPPQPNQQPKPGGPRNIVQTAPPIAVTIVPKQLAKVAVPQNNPKIKAGGKTRSCRSRWPGSSTTTARSRSRWIRRRRRASPPTPATIKAGEDEAKLTLDGGRRDAQPAATRRSRCA